MSEACDFIKIETLAQVFFCEFCEIFKNTFFYRTHLVAASHKSRITESAVQNKILKRIRNCFSCLIPDIP